jgi:hypothetical protein
MKRFYMLGGQACGALPSAALRESRDRAANWGRSPETATPAAPTRRGGFLVLVSLALACGHARAAAPQFAVTWTAPTTNEDSTPIAGAITYQLYAGGSGKEAKLGNPVASPPYVISPTPPPGTTQCVQVTAIVGGVESQRSSEVCATVPLPQPNPPSVIVITIK